MMVLQTLETLLWQTEKPGSINHYTNCTNFMLLPRPNVAGHRVRIIQVRPTIRVLLDGRVHCDGLHLNVRASPTRAGLDVG